MLKKKHAILFFLFILKKKGGDEYNLQNTVSNMTNRTLCKNHVVLQRMRLACVRIHNTHTQVKPRDEKKKITETLKKIKGQIARDKGRGGEGRGAFRASVRAPDHRTEKSRPSAPAAKSNPASSGKKKKKKTPMQACYFEK